MDVSVIVRFRNEDKTLGAVLTAIRQQSCPELKFEIIAVDNQSTDRSAEIASEYSDVILTASDYRPGKALNQAIELARGQFPVIISAHAIPSNNGWLSNLCAARYEPHLAGIYGAQLYPTDSRFLDKWDLDIFATTEPRIEMSDSDFWNANSLVNRALWESTKFDESVFELEDHYWTKQVLPQGHHIRFEPTALVYHYGHSDRNDREHLPESDETESERIEKSIQTLANPQSTWPMMMRAGLTLGSLTHVPQVRSAVPALGKTLEEHSDFDVRWRVAGVLGKIRDERAALHLRNALTDPSFYVRDEAAWSLARLGDIGANTLMERPPITEPTSTALFALALGRSGQSSAEDLAVTVLSDELTSESAIRRISAVYVAGEIVQAREAKSLVPAIQGLMREADDQLLSVCCWAIGCFASVSSRIDWDEIRQVANEHLQMPVRFEALVAMGKRALAFPTVENIDDVAKGLADGEGRVRYGTMQCLRQIVEKSGVDLLTQSARSRILEREDDEDFGVRFELALLNDLVTRIESADENQIH